MSITIVLDLIHVIHYLWTIAVLLCAGKHRAADAWVGHILFQLLTRHPLHNRRVDRRQPIKKLALQLYRVEHERLRFWQLGGEPLGTTLNKFSEGLRLSAPRQT